MKNYHALIINPFPYITFFIYAIFFSPSYSKEIMQFREYFLEELLHGKYTKEIPTEAIAYQLLKQNPIKKNITYVALPWSEFLQKNNLTALKNIRVKNGFTVCQDHHFEKAIPLFKQMGITTVFTPHAGYAKRTYGTIKIIPFPSVAINTAKPQKKDVFYSFIGAKNNLVRIALFNSKHPQNTVVKSRERWHYHQPNLNKRKKEFLEYQDVLSRSRFSLCPPGTGLQTIRFWESLCAGAIPVLVAAQELELPKGFDWTTCILRISPNNVTKIPKILSNITPAQEEVMRKNCLIAYDLFSGENLIKVIHDYYNHL